MGILHREATHVKHLCAVRHCPSTLIPIAQVSIYVMLLYYPIRIVIAAPDVLRLFERFWSLFYHTKKNLNTVSLA